MTQDEINKAFLNAPPYFSQDVIDLALSPEFEKGCKKLGEMLGGPFPTIDITDVVNKRLAELKKDDHR